MLEGGEDYKQFLNPDSLKILKNCIFEKNVLEDYKNMQKD